MSLSGSCKNFGLVTPSPGVYGINCYITLNADYAVTCFISIGYLHISSFLLSINKSFIYMYC